MSRRFLQFDCEGARLSGTLAHADGTIGLLIVSGGNETRSGPFASQASLAREIKRRGYPVFRFDRRGVGDSEGENRGFRSSAADIAAALEAFRQACPQMKHVVAYGNCDAASALMLQGGAGCNALVLSNPWTFDEEDAVAPVHAPQAVRSRYARKLRQASEWQRLLTGDVSLRKLIEGLRTAMVRTSSQSDLVAAMQDAMASYNGSVLMLVSGLDRTGQAFRSAWGGRGKIVVLERADHAFSENADRMRLEDLIGSTLDEQARQLDVG